jgi:hypothetical protein
MESASTLTKNTRLKVTSGVMALALALLTSAACFFLSTTSANAADDTAASAAASAASAASAAPSGKDTPDEPKKDENANKDVKAHRDWNPSRETVLELAIPLCFLYWAFMVAARWHRIARPTREMLRAQLWCLLIEVDLLVVSPGLDKVKEILNSGLKLIGADLSDSRGWDKLKWTDVLFWSRGHETTGWGYVHEAEVKAVPFLDDDTVWVKLKCAEETLRTAADTGSVTLADLINKDISSTPMAARSRLNALLSSALTRNYDREDTSFINMVTWQNKTSWLVVTGLLLILAVSGVEPRTSIFFLMGALGGLVSRMTRSLDRKDVPTDYGASWTTLFLSPVSGALGAWVGLTIANLAVDLNVLGGVFANRWDYPADGETLAIALLFGFSERLLDTILDKLTDATISSNAKVAAAPAAKAPVGAPPGGGGAAPPVPASAGGVVMLPPAVVGQAYGPPLQLNPADPTAAWAKSAGQLPPGLSLNQDGSFGGTPDAAATGQTFRFSAVATNAAGVASTQRCSLTVQANP